MLLLKFNVLGNPQPLTVVQSFVVLVPGLLAASPKHFSEVFLLTNHKLFQTPDPLFLATTIHSSVWTAVIAVVSTNLPTGVDVSVSSLSLDSMFTVPSCITGYNKNEGFIDEAVEGQIQTKLPNRIQKNATVGPDQVTNTVSDKRCV